MIDSLIACFKKEMTVAKAIRTTAKEKGEWPSARDVLQAQKALKKDDDEEDDEDSEGQRMIDREIASY